MSILEPLIQKIGQELLASLETYKPDKKHRTLHFFLSTVSQNPKLMRQLLRLTDVLSALHGGKGDNRREVAEHVRQYVGDVNQFFKTILYGTKIPGIESLTAIITEKMVLKIARRFIAGENFQEAIPVLDQLEKGELPLTVTFDLLGELVVSEQEAKRYEEMYLSLIQEMGKRYPGRPRTKGGVPLGHVSLKLSSLSSQFNPADPRGTKEVVVARLVRLFKEAKKQGIMINVDLEQSTKVEIAYDIFKTALQDPELIDFPDVAVVMQGFLRRSPEIYEDLLRWVKNPLVDGGRGGVPIQVRLVKGAYWDFENAMSVQKHWPSPVFSKKVETDQNFETLTRRMLEDENWKYIKPAFATHNARSMACAIANGEDLSVPPEQIEFQMLYGMEDDLRYALAKRGCSIRVYTPVGNMIEGIAYLVRRILENASQQGFVQMKRGRRDAKVLLASPFAAGPGLGVSSDSSRLTKPAFEAAEDSTTRHPLQFQNEPTIDFSLKKEQERMQSVLASVRNEFGKSYKMLIAGEWIDSSQWHTACSPYNKSVELGKFPFANMDQVDGAIHAAHSQSEQWRNRSAEERASYLVKAAELMRKRRFELSAWIVHEVAKNWAEADADVVEAIDFLEYYASEAIRISKETDLYEGRGVSVVLPPWNFPLAIAAGMTVAALVSGNTVVLKPSERSCLMGAKLAEILADPAVGLPKGVFNCIYGDRDVGARLVASDKVSMIAFTGSKAVGLNILGKSGEEVYSEERGTIKKVIAEMGGKNCVIIDRDANPDEAVLTVMQSAFNFQGQKCSAASRVLIQEDIYDKFLERIQHAIESLPVGAPEDPRTILSSVIDDRSVQNINDILEKEGGSQERISHENGGDCFVPPTLIKDVSEKHALAQKELFGPVLTVLKYKTFEDALRIANGTEYALTGGLISRNLKNTEKFKKEMASGNLYINRNITGAIVERQPFGGFKMSGTGPKAGGNDYLYHFMKVKQVKQNYRSRKFESEPIQLRKFKAGAFKSQISRLRKRQNDWSQVSASKRIAVLEKLLSPMDITFIRGLGNIWKNIEQLSAYRLTQKMPGEINEIIHGPKGLGLFVASDQATLGDQVAAVVAALGMGNGLLVTGESFDPLFSSLMKALTKEVPLHFFPSKDGSSLLKEHGFEFLIFGGRAEEGAKAYHRMTKSITTCIPSFIGIPFETSSTAPDFVNRFTCPQLICENSLQEGVDMRSDFL